MYRYFQIYPSPDVPAALGSKSTKVGSSRDCLPCGLSGLWPLLIQRYTFKIAILQHNIVSHIKFVEDVLGL